MVNRQRTRTSHSRLGRAFIYSISLIRKRPTYVGVIILILIVGILLLLLASRSRNFWTDVALNGGVTLLGAILVIFLLEPTLEALRTVWHEELPRLRVMGYIRQAKSSVIILETWSGLVLQENERKEFERALNQALLNGCVVRVLLLNPESPASTIRASELPNVKTVAEMYENVAFFAQLENHVDPKVRGLELRLYDALPSFQYYQAGSKAFVSFFPLGTRASRNDQLEISSTSQLASLCRQRFDELWTHRTTNVAETLYRIRLQLRSDHTGASTELLADYLRMPDGTVVVSLDRTMIDLTGHSSLTITVENEDVSYSTEEVTQGDLATTLHRAKYPHSSDDHVLIRLKP